jgi:serine/threonine protein kinase
MAITVERFIERLSESGLMPAAEISAFQESLPPDEQPRDVQALAVSLVKAGKLTKYQAKAIYEGKSKALVFGQYVVLDKLGEGGVGVVLKAQHRRMKRLVAIKVLSASAMKVAGSIERFYREVEAAAKLSHPNIVTAYDASEHAGMHYLVMEYVEGRDLASLVKERGPLEVGQAVECILQAARGLQYAHGKGIVHRDIKPSNLLLDKDGTVKILDMGLARIAGSEASLTGLEQLTAAGQVMGTGDYMSPEQAFDSHNVDVRADIYSLGCTLYRLLTGMPPYARDSLMQTLIAHREAPIPSLAETRPDVPPALEAVFRKMVAKDPDDRFATSAEVADAVGPLADGSELAGLTSRVQLTPVAPPTQAQSPTAGSLPPSLTQMFQEHTPKIFQPPRPTTPRIPIPRQRLVLIAGSACLLLLLVLAIWAVWPRHHGSPPPVPSGALLVDWPQRSRSGGRLWIDKTPVEVPAAGAIACPCAPGKHEVRAERPRYRPWKQAVEVRPGDRRQVAPVWTPQPYLLIRWTQEERQGATLQIDDCEQDLDAAGVETTPERVELPIEPGQHKMRIIRPGFKPFTNDATVGEALDWIVVPVWTKKVESPAPPANPSETAKPKSQDELQPGVQPAKTAKPKSEDEPEKSLADLLKDTKPTKTTEEAEKAEKAETKPPEKPVPVPGPSEEESRELTKLEAAEARYAKALEPVEDLVAAWSFRAALAAIGKVHFDDRADAARLSARSSEVQRLAAFKDRMMAKICEADPPLTKNDLSLRGANGEVIKADETGITAKLPSGKVELHAWADLDEAAWAKICKRTVDPASADDWIASALLAIPCGNTALAARCFEKARSLGSDVQPYLTPLAKASLARAMSLLQKKDFAEAETELAAVDKKYGKVPWVLSHKIILDVARREAKAGLYEQRAEKLYEEAAQLYRDSDFFEARPRLKTLKAEYAGSRPVTETKRKPSFAEMQRADARLGKLLAVRQDGGGKFKTIQEAIKAASPNSTIEIQDSGRYDEFLVVPEEAAGLTIRGQKDCWPVIRSNTKDTSVLLLHTPVTLVNLVLLHEQPWNSGVNAVIDCRFGRQNASEPMIRVRRCVLATGGAMLFDGDAPRVMEAETCILIGPGRCPRTLSNCVWLAAPDYSSPGGGDLACNCLFDNRFSWSRGQVKSCTIIGGVGCGRELKADDVINDSVVSCVESPVRGPRIENCDVYGERPYRDLAAPGTSCFSADPRFVDPSKLDYRLGPDSPCCKKASDGGDLGFRYTPEIVDMLKTAFRLRDRGIVRFGPAKK